MINAKQKSFLIATAPLLLVIATAAGILYLLNQPKVLAPIKDSLPQLNAPQEEGNDKVSEAIQKEQGYRDARLNFSFAPPSSWFIEQVLAYPSLSLADLVKKFNPDWRALEVGRTYVSSNRSVSNCVKLARGIGSCLTSGQAVQTGAYLSIVTDYRAETTIEAVESRDKQEVGAIFESSDITVAGQKTLVWTNAPACAECVFSKTYVFAGKPHFVHKITAEIYKNPSDQLSDTARAQYVQSFEMILKSFQLN